MSTHRKHFHTLEEYFALEKVGDARYEYWNGEIVSMSGGSEAHARISGNVFYGLRTQLRGRTCTAFTSEVSIKTIKHPPYRYPDASVVGGKAIFEKMEGIAVLTNPILLVEVLSSHTEKADRGVKFEAYKAIETVREYVLIAQHEPHLTHFVRQENGEWSRFDTADMQGAIRLESIECTLALADVYEEVTFE